MSTAGSDREPGRHPSQVIALTVGALYTLLGIVGFFVTGLDDFAGVTGETLLGFELNPLHNIVHLGIGLLGLGMSGTVSSARGFGWVLAIAYGATFAYGLFAVDDPAVNFLSLNTADNVLHLVTALAGLVAALWPAGARARAAA